MNIPKVSDIMATSLFTFLPTDNIHSAAKTLLDNRLSGAPVIDAEGNLLGMLSKKDCLQVVYSASYHQDWGGTVAEFMSTPVETVPGDLDIVMLADKFVRSIHRRFPVVKNGLVVGQVSRADVLKALYLHW